MEPNTDAIEKTASGPERVRDWNLPKQPEAGQRLPRSVDR
jgi:hypothetical protein